MMPWERDIYLALLKDYIEGEKSEETTKGRRPEVWILKHKQKMLKYKLLKFSTI